MSPWKKRGRHERRKSSHRAYRKRLRIMLYTLGAVALLVTPAMLAWAYFQHGATQVRLLWAAAGIGCVAVGFLLWAKLLEVLELRRYARSRGSISYSSAR